MKTLIKGYADLQQLTMLSKVNISYRNKSDFQTQSNSRFTIVSLSTKHNRRGHNLYPLKITTDFFNLTPKVLRKIPSWIDMYLCILLYSILLFAYYL